MMLCKHNFILIGGWFTPQITGLQGTDQDGLYHKFLARRWKVKAQEAWNATKLISYLLFPLSSKENQSPEPNHYCNF